MGSRKRDTAQKERERRPIIGAHFTCGKQADQRHEQHTPVGKFLGRRREYDSGERSGQWWGAEGEEGGWNKERDRDGHAEHRIVGPADDLVEIESSPGRMTADSPRHGQREREDDQLAADQTT